MGLSSTIFIKNTLLEVDGFSYILVSTTIRSIVVFSFTILKVIDEDSESWIKPQAVRSRTSYSSINIDSGFLAISSIDKYSFFWYNKCSTCIFQKAKFVLLNFLILYFELLAIVPTQTKKNGQHYAIISIVRAWDKPPFRNLLRKCDICGKLSSSISEHTWRRWKSKHKEKHWIYVEKLKNDKKPWSHTAKKSTMKENRVEMYRLHLSGAICTHLWSL